MANSLPTVAEEKVDEFILNFSGSPQSNSSWSCKSASCSQTQSFSIGSYCWQSLLQTSWSSSNAIDVFHIHAHEIDAIIEECLDHNDKNESGLSADFYGNKKPPTPCLSSCFVNKDPGSEALQQRPRQQSPFLRTTSMHEEDVKYLGRVLSNSRPPPNFLYAQPTRRAAAGAPQGEESTDSPLVLFDASHGKSIFYLLQVIHRLFS
jgi:hypothetical protein